MRNEQVSVDFRDYLNEMETALNVAKELDALLDDMYRRKQQGVATNTRPKLRVVTSS